MKRKTLILSAILLLVIGFSPCQAKPVLVTKTFVVQANEDDAYSHQKNGITWLSSLGDREELFRRAPRQQDAYEFLESAGGSAELAHLLEGGSFSRSVIAGLEEKGVVEVEEEEILRDPFKSHPPSSPKPLVPTPDQASVLSGLLKGLEDSPPLPALLQPTPPGTLASPTLERMGAPGSDHRMTAGSGEHHRERAGVPVRSHPPRYL